MRKQIKVWNDSGNISLSTEDISFEKSYILSTGNYIQTTFTEDELRELKVMIEEIIQLANKQDY